MDKIMLWPGVAPDTDICGQQAQPSLTAFPAEGARGAVIVCPGGAYVGKAEHEGAPVARMLHEAGVAAYVLDYRVKPFRLETALGDALRAIRVVRQMGYEKVGIMGFSAGGHLSGAAATLYTPGDPEAEDPVERLSSRPDVFIPCYGATSFRMFRQLSQWDWPTDVLGAERGQDEALIDRYSAERNVTGDTPPAFIWHTADDSVVPVEMALALAAALRKNGVDWEMHIYPHGQHGLGLAQDDPVVHGWCALCRAWLLRQGFGRAE